MSHKIGNVGLLNLLNATESTIRGIESIENAGAVYYRSGNVHLLSLLNISNIGKTVEVQEGYTFYNGTLNINSAFLQSIKEPVQLFVNGQVVIDKSIMPNQLQKGLLQLIVSEKIYCPCHLSGSLTHLISKGTMEIVVYENNPPRHENGNLELTNSFLQSLDKETFLVVKGALSFSKDLNMELFNEKIGRLDVKGFIKLYSNQETYFHKKVSSMTGAKVEIVPDGFVEVNNKLRLNSRNIRRFKLASIFTKNPIVFEADVTRELAASAFSAIQSSSIIICQEELEDLIFEMVGLAETEILTYQNSFTLTEGKEVWSNEQLMAFHQPNSFFVEGQLVFDEDVTEETIKNKVYALDNFGSIIVREKRIKAALNSKIRLNYGSIEEETLKERGTGLQNIGELSL